MRVPLGTRAHLWVLHWASVSTVKAEILTVGGPRDYINSYRGHPHLIAYSELHKELS